MYGDSGLVRYQVTGDDNSFLFCVNTTFSLSGWGVPLDEWSALPITFTTTAPVTLNLWLHAAGTGDFEGGLVNGYFSGPCGLLDGVGPMQPDTSFAISAQVELLADTQYTVTEHVHVEGAGLGDSAFIMWLTPIPEPSSFILCLVGAISFLAYRRQRSS